MSYRAEELFASTASYYARYRPGYAPDLVEHLVQRFDLDHDQRVLDIGTGTGVLALGLAPHVAQVVAVDPETGMLTEAGRAAAERGVTNVDWRRGDSITIPGMGLGTFRLATFGQSFHWTDRPRMLADLDSMIDDRGGVAVISDPLPGVIEPAPWLAVIADIRARYLGPQRRAGTGTYTHPTESHHDVLGRSAFSDIEVIGWDWTLTRTVEELVGLQFSYSFSSPAQLGPDKEAFERDVRDALTGLTSTGRFQEAIRTEAIIAVRPPRPARSRRD